MGNLLEPCTLGTKWSLEEVRVKGVLKHNCRGRIRAQPLV